MRARIRTQRCDAICARERGCGLPGTSDCEQRCGAQPVAYLDHVRVDFAWKLIACLEGADCQSITDGVADSRCETWARGLFDATPLLRDFCFESSKRASACGQAGDQSECLERYRPIDDASLEQALACLGRPCAEIPGCFTEAFGYVR